MSVNVGRLVVTQELLLQLLHLPPDTVVTNTYLGAQWCANCVVFILYHKDLPAVETYGDIPLLQPVWLRSDELVPGATFAGWGVTP